MGALAIYYLPLKSGDCRIPKSSIPQILRFAHGCLFFMATCSAYGTERKQFRAGTAMRASTMNRQDSKAQNFKKGISPFLLLTILPDPQVLAIRQRTVGEKGGSKGCDKELGHRLCKALF